MTTITIHEGIATLEDGSTVEVPELCGDPAHLIRQIPALRKLAKELIDLRSKVTRAIHIMNGDRNRPLSRLLSARAVLLGTDDAPFQD